MRIQIYFFTRAMILTMGLLGAAVLTPSKVAISQTCISTFPYIENFENGPAGWFKGAYSTNNSWAFGNPNKLNIQGCASGDSCWTTGGLAFQRYRPLEESYVQSPCFNFTNLTNPVVVISINYDIENPFDGAALMSSVDSGATWQAVGTNTTGLNWYDAANISSGPGTPAGIPQNTMGWTGSYASNSGSGGWIRAQHDLTGLGGESHVLLRIALAADPITQYDGIAFDDVVIEEKPFVNLGPDLTLCFGDVGILNLPCCNGCTFKWSTGALDTLCFLRAVPPQGQGKLFWGEITDSLGVKARDSVYIRSSPTALPGNLGDTIFCPGDTVCMDAKNFGATHKWFAYDTTTNLYILRDTTQIICTDTTVGIIVEVSDQLGCVERDTFTLFRDIVPPIDLGADDTVCVGEAIILTAPPGAPGTSYFWTRSGIFFAPTQTVFPSAPGLFKVVLTTPAGCQNSDSMNLDVKLSPVVNLGPDGIECDSVTLNALNTGSSFQWSTGANTQTIDIFPPFSGWVTVTNTFGCVNSDTIDLTYGNPPVIDLGGDRVVCNASFLLLDAGFHGVGTRYKWSNGGVLQQLIVTDPGFYFVTVTDSNGCKGSDSLNVTISTLAVDLGGDTAICVGKTLVFDASAPGATYRWNTGSTSPILTINQGGVYWVDLRDTLGCVATDTIIVQQKPAFNGAFNTSPSMAVELGNPHSFTAVNYPAGTNSFKWRFGDGKSGNGATVTHTFSSLDTFNVCLVISDGQCSDTACSTAGTYLRFLAIEEEMGLDLDIFPNPSNGSFQIDMDLSQPSSVFLAVYDLQGKTVFKKELPFVIHHEEAISLDGDAKGIYLLQLATPKGTTYRKLVIK